MECDSVHSSIERKLKNREIHLPSDYVPITKEARKEPKQFKQTTIFFKTLQLLKLGFTKASDLDVEQVIRKLSTLKQFFTAQT